MYSGRKRSFMMTDILGVENEHADCRSNKELKVEINGDDDIFDSKCAVQRLFG
jgi:hypothetical protein